MIRLNLKELTSVQKTAVLEFKSIFNFEESSQGITLRFQNADKNTSILENNHYNITYKNYSFVFRSLKNLFQGIIVQGKETTENMCFEKLGIMLDCSRNGVYTCAAVKELIKTIAAAGYNTLQLYTEDTYEISNRPYFGYLRGRYTKQEIIELDSYAQLFGIEIIPCIQTLAHLNQIFRWQPFEGVNDIQDILLVGADKTYEFIDDMFKSVSECFKSKNINIGMDEAFLLGRGKFADLNGFVERFDIMKKHLDKVLEIADKYGYSCLMWSDMFFKIAFGDYYNYNKEMTQKAKDSVPKNLKLIYWDYYSRDFNRYDGMLSKHSEFDNETVFGGGAWTWIGFCPATDYAIDATEKAFDACKKHRVKEAFLTMWQDNGSECSPFAALPTLIYAAEKAYGNGNLQAVKDSFYTLTNTSYDSFMDLCLPDRPDGNEYVTNNPSKYYLYNDLFMGTHDGSVLTERTEHYKVIAEKLKKHEVSNGRYAYLFKKIRVLCEVLYLKYDLGIKTRQFYMAKENQLLKDLINNNYIPLVVKLKEFYSVFKKEWLFEKKPHGFDVQDIRLGGLIARTESCTQRLISYLQGKTSIIEELDEEILDIFGKGNDLSKEIYNFNNYQQNVTVNIL